MPVTYDPIKKVWTGAEMEYPYRADEGVGEVLFNALRENLSHVCQISDDSGEIYTNERMLKAGICFANALKAKGLKKGDNVIFLMHNHHYLLPMWAGCLFIGVNLCPFYFIDSSVRAELNELVKQVNPKMMITTYYEAIDVFKAIFDDNKIDCPVYVYENKIPGCFDLKPLLEDYSSDIESFKPIKIKDARNEIFVVLLSSSTTGKPKLINGTHASLLQQSIGPYANIRAASTMEPGWITELLFSLIILIKQAVKITRAHYTIDEFLLMIEKHQVELITIKPKEIFSIIKTNTIKNVNLESIKLVMSVGEHMSVKMAEDLIQYLPNGEILSLYGMSDIGGGCTEKSDLPRTVPQLVGRVKQGFKIKVVDDAGNRKGPNETGEICIKSEFYPFPGYYKNIKMTQEAVTPDGYFLSGDIGYLDADGNVFLIERKKFNISYDGKLLNQGDVERIVLENVDGVNGCCVVDVESDKHGVMPLIAVIPEKGKTLSEDEIIKTIMKHHPFEFETKVFFFDKLPMTISSKYRKHVIRDMIVNRMREI